MYSAVFSRILALLVLSIVSASTVYATSAITSDEAENLVNRYITGLSAGNVDEIRSVIGGALLERSEHSLDRGEKYGAFLRKHYQGVQMSVSSVEQSGNQQLVSVLFVYPAGDIETTVFTVGDNNGQPRIIDEKM